MQDLAKDFNAAADMLLSLAKAWAKSPKAKDKQTRRPRLSASHPKLGEVEAELKVKKTKLPKSKKPKKPGKAVQMAAAGKVKNKMRFK